MKTVKNFSNQFERSNYFDDPNKIIFRFS